MVEANIRTGDIRYLFVYEITSSFIKSKHFEVIFYVYRLKLQLPEFVHEFIAKRVIMIFDWPEL